MGGYRTSLQNGANQQIPDDLTRQWLGVMVTLHLTITLHELAAGTP
jgi:hypothetical protein